MKNYKILNDNVYINHRSFLCVLLKDFSGITREGKWLSLPLSTIREKWIDLSCTLSIAKELDEDVNLFLQEFDPDIQDARNELLDSKRVFIANCNRD